MITFSSSCVWNPRIETETSIWLTLMAFPPHGWGVAKQPIFDLNVDIVKCSCVLSRVTSRQSWACSWKLC